MSAIFTVAGFCAIFAGEYGNDVVLGVEIYIYYNAAMYYYDSDIRDAAVM